MLWVLMSVTSENPNMFSWRNKKHTCISPVFGQKKTSSIGLDMSGYQVNSFLISP